MESSLTNIETKETQNTHEERIQKIDSDIKSKNKQLNEELENSQDDNSRLSQTDILDLPTKKKENLKFAPFLLNTLDIPRERIFGEGAVFYNEKHNLIMVHPHKNPIHFYDVTNLLQIEAREKFRLDEALFDVSFCSETDTFLFACSNGYLYAFDFNKKSLKKVQKFASSFLPAVSFVNSDCYVFSANAPYLFVGNLKDESFIYDIPAKARIWSLQKFENENLLLSGLEKGKMVIYRTDRLPRLPVVCSVQAHYDGIVNTNKEKAVIDGKELIITRGNDGKMKVWHFVKGKMRLLRVIQIGEYVEGPCIYLESYKMICTTKGKESLKFFSSISGGLKNTIELKRPKALSVVFMKDKNALGVADWSRKVLDIIYLKQEKEDLMMEV